MQERRSLEARGTRDTHAYNFKDPSTHLWWDVRRICDDETCSEQFGAGQTKGPKAFELSLEMN